MTGSSRFQFDGYELDPATRELRHGSELVPLEPQVFDLLVYVIRNRDRVVSKDDLVEVVWGGRIVSDSTLTTRINAMRKALGDSGEEQRLIRTVARKGIRFVGAVTEGESAAPASRPAEASASDRPTLPLPDKPSIAVLPFQNMSGDPEQDYFADGMVEEITTALSRFHWLFVIARNSSFTYKGRHTDVKQVSRELGVRYVLEGSVRKAGTRVRITGQLIDATTGSHLWADRFDGALDDIFALQDQVTASVVSTIEPRLRQVEVERASRKPTENLDAYDLYLRALPHFETLTAEGYREALRLLKLAGQMDPRFALAHATAASCHVWQRNSGWSIDQEAEATEALSLARTALALDRNDAEILTYAATTVRAFARDMQEARVLIDLALSINSNSARAWGASGMIHVHAGNTQAAIEHSERALRCSPFDTRKFYYQGVVGMAHFFDGRLDQAIEWLGNSTKAQPQFPTSFAYLAASFAHAGRLDEARAALQRRLAFEPSLTASVYRKRARTLRPHHHQYYFDGLMKAGLPE